MNEEFESDLLFPTLIAKNKRGEVVFSMKRKGEKFGQLYYLFEFRWDRVDPDEMARLGAVWAVTKLAAANMGIPLYQNLARRPSILMDG